jgi:hypothetical protein
MGGIFQTVETIDGKRIRTVKPAKSGSFFSNYEEYYSIVLTAIVNVGFVRDLKW